MRQSLCHIQYSGFKVRNKTLSFIKCYMDICTVEYYIAIKNEKGFLNILIGNNLQDIMSNGKKVEDGKYARICSKRKEIHLYLYL